MFAVGKTSGNDEVAPLAGRQKDAKETACITELFLDNKMIEMSPSGQDLR